MADNGTVNYTGTNDNEVVKTGISGKIQRDIAQRTLNQLAYSDNGVIKNLLPQINAVNKAVDLQTKSGQKLATQIKAITTELEKVGETQEVSYNELKKIVTETYDIIKKGNEEQIKSLQKQLALLDKSSENYQERYDELTEELNQVNQANAEMQDYLMDITDQLEKAGKILKENTKSWSKGISETLGNVSSSLGDLANMFNIDKLANSGLNQFVSSKLEVQNNMMKDFGMTSQAQYLSFKNNLDNTLKDMGNLYSASDLKTYMSSLFDLGITDTDTAEKMASSSMMATKYLGVSNETQEQIFKYMKRTNDYDMLDEHNKTITGILSAQLGVSREQLDSLTTIAYGNDTELTSLGMNQQTLQAMNEAEVISMSALTGKDVGLTESAANALNNLYTQYLGMNITDRAKFGQYLGSSADQIYATGWSDQSVEGQAKNMQAFVKALSSSGYLSGSGENYAQFLKTIQGVLGNIDTEALAALRTVDTDKYSESLDNALTEIADGTKSVEDFVESTTELTAVDEIQNMLDQFISGIDWGGFTNVVWASAAAWGGSSAFKFLNTGITLYKDLSKGASSIIEGAKGASKLATSGSGLLATGGGILIGAAAVTAIVTAITAWQNHERTEANQAAQSDAAEALKGTALEDNSAMIGAYGIEQAAQTTGGSGSLSATGSALSYGFQNLFGSSNRTTLNKKLTDWMYKSNTLSSSGKALAWALMLASVGDLSAFNSATGTNMTINDLKELLAQEVITEDSVNKQAANFISAGNYPYLDSNKNRMKKFSLDATLDGYHKNGKYYIPRDNYHALLHKGEMVLNANQARALREGYGYGGSLDTVGPHHSGYAGHKGIDLYFNTVGTPVGSAVPGTVSASYDIAYNPNDGKLHGADSSGNKYSSYGRVVKIKGNNGLTYIYGHLDRRMVSTGQQVNAGDLIGYSGTTGNSSGPHLHFEIEGLGEGEAKHAQYYTSSVRNIGDTSGAVEQSSAVSSLEDTSTTSSSTSMSTSSRPIITGRKLPSAAVSNSGGMGGAGLVANSVDNGINKIINYLDSIKNEQNIQREMLNAFSRANSSSAITS